MFIGYVIAGVILCITIIGRDVSYGSIMPASPGSASRSLCCQIRALPLLSVVQVLSVLGALLAAVAGAGVLSSRRTRLRSASTISCSSPDALEPHDVATTQDVREVASESSRVLLESDRAALFRTSCWRASSRSSSKKRGSTVAVGISTS